MAEDGSLLCGSDDIDVELAFDQWRCDQACEHERGILVHHHIGNIALVAALRAELQRMPDKFPLILSRVLYNGTHCGDFIAVGELPAVCAEVAALESFQVWDLEMKSFIRAFERQMTELVRAALTIGKPIAF
jgi:hypothetical protein